MEQVDIEGITDRLYAETPDDVTIGDIKKQIAVYVIEGTIESISSRDCATLLNFYLGNHLDLDDDITYAEWNVFLTNNKKEICEMAKQETADRLNEFLDEPDEMERGYSTAESKGAEPYRETEESSSGSGLSEKERIKISELDVPAFTVKLLQIAGIKTVGEMMEFERDDSDGIAGIAWVDERKITKLNTALAEQGVDAQISLPD
jgi:hypothetical protein